MIIEAREDTITLRGAVHSNIWPAIQAAASLLLENHPTGIIIDCSALTRITPKGAETFADAFEYIQTRNARIIVIGLSQEMVEIGKTVPGVRSQLPIASSIEEARASLALGELTLRRGRARVTAVVPILGNWRRAIYFADNLAAGESCEVHLIDLIQVPRTLPLGTPLPERESLGQKRLEEAMGLVHKMGLKSFTHVERARSKFSGLIDFAHRLNVDFSVVSIDCPERDAPCIDQSEAMTLIETANFNISLIKGAPAVPDRPVVNIVVPALGKWNRAMEHACKLASKENAVVTMLFIIAIPRAEPLDVSKPDAEAAASDAAKEAQRIGKRYGVTVNAISERVRDPILGLLKIIEAHEFDLAVIATKQELVEDYHIAQAATSALLDELPCETVFLRVGKE